MTASNSFYRNKHKLSIYRIKIVAINKTYRTLYYDNILKDSTNTKKMWDNVNMIINKKRQHRQIASKRQNL